MLKQHIPSVTNLFDIWLGTYDFDFLLGQPQDPVRKEVQNWVAEHQARLNVAFEGPCKWLSAAAGRREHHHQLVHATRLQVGQLVYLWVHNAKGQTSATYGTGVVSASR